MGWRRELRTDEFEIDHARGRRRLAWLVTIVAAGLAAFLVGRW